MNDKISIKSSTVDDLNLSNLTLDKVKQLEKTEDESIRYDLLDQYLKASPEEQRQIFTDNIEKELRMKYNLKSILVQSYNRLENIESNGLKLKHDLDIIAEAVGITDKIKTEREQNKK